MLAFSVTTNVKNHKPSDGIHSSVIVASFPFNSDKQPTGDSPFIRFHSATYVTGISISTPNVLPVFLKPINTTPEKFIGIVEYLSSLSCILPVTREFLYATPLRSPPIFS
jgi:hypothetical protein